MMSFLNNYIVANLLMLVISFFTLTGIHWTIKRFFAKHIQENRWTWFFGSIILTIILLGILRNKSLEGYFTYLVDSFMHADLLVILGLVFGILACIIGMAVFERITYTEAKDLTQFLHIYNEILEESSKDDKLLILLPSYYIGGTGSVKLKKSKQEAELSQEHVSNCKMFKNAFTDNVKIYLAILDYSNTRFDELNATTIDHYDIIREVQNQPLKNFHWKVADELLDSNDDKITYFKQYYEFSNEINALLGSPSVTKLKETYDTDNKICGIINLSKGIAVFGSYKIKGGIDLAGSKIKSKNAVDCIKDLFADVIKKNNTDTSFDFNTWLQ